MANTVAWLEIPTKDLDRAIKFYTKVLAGEVKKEIYEDNFAMGMLPGGAGCLYVEKNDITNEMGPLVYFNVNGRLDDAEKKIPESGGQV